MFPCKTHRFQWLQHPFLFLADIPGPKDESLLLRKFLISFKRNNTNYLPCILMASGSIPLRKPLNLDSLVFKIKINLAPFAVAIYPIPVDCNGIFIFCLLQIFKMHIHDVARTIFDQLHCQPIQCSMVGKLNYNLLTPPPKYRTEAERQIREAGCRTRKDSVRLVETLITASPEFFREKRQQEIRAFFERVMEFMKTKQNPNTFVSAVVHMDEKTPHMHLCFVPITEDGRLSAKDIDGNKKKLTQWQDEYWSYMVKKYPDLERGESASETGRTHIPPRIFKQATKMRRLEQKLRELLASINPMNAKRVREEILKILDEYIPGVAELMTKTKALKKAEKELLGEIAVLKKEANSSKPSVQRLLELEKKAQDQEALQRTIMSLQQTLTAIPHEILAEYSEPKSEGKEQKIHEAV